MRIANLPWYDFHELSGATDALWSGIARHLAAAGVDDVPERLDRETDHRVQWRQPNLLLSQACGYDVLYDSATELEVVATPCFVAEGCDQSSYRSAVVVRDLDRVTALEELRGSVCVINEATSHSGTNALRPLVAPLSRGGRFFGEVRASGDHATSLEMVAAGLADVACVDVVVWELCRRVRPRTLHGLRVLRFTEKAPAPPYVTSKRTPPDVMRGLREALAAAMADPELCPVREALLIGGVEMLGEDTYRALVHFERPALDFGYAELPSPRCSPLFTQMSPSPAPMSHP